MNPDTHIAAPRRRGAEHRIEHACDACGQAFTLHYSVVRAVALSPSRVPCMNDACGCDVVVLLPPGAFAVWTEEISF
jgi:hypothetical protein